MQSHCLRYILYIHNTRNADPQYIINFINNYRDQFTISNLDDYLRNYDYDTLTNFFNGGYNYSDSAVLISNPSEMNLVIKDNETVYRYVPTDLKAIDGSIIPYISSISGEDTIYVKNDIINPLKQMGEALSKENGEINGGLILTSGYISYDKQRELYDSALLKYGTNDVLKYSDYPGCSDSQLGYSVTFTIADMDENEIKESNQVKWLKDNAYKYGFIIRFPDGKEKITGKNYQPLTLRYVGNEEAKSIYEEASTLELFKSKD